MAIFRSTPGFKTKGLTALAAALGLEKTKRKGRRSSGGFSTERTTISCTRTTVEKHDRDPSPREERKCIISNITVGRSPRRAHKQQNLPRQAVIFVQPYTFQMKAGRTAASGQLNFEGNVRILQVSQHHRSVVPLTVHVALSVPITGSSCLYLFPY